MRFETLDALRGVAAIFVLIHHFPDFFGGWRPPLADSMVDFFFVLSGFVLAKSYGDQVSQGKDAWRLTRLRVVRIYPLYLAGTLIGIVPLILSVLLHGSVSEYYAAFWLSIPFAILMVPSPGFLGLVPVYPLNVPAWSLFFEMVANVVWFVLGRHLTLGRLVIGLIVSAVGLWYLRGHLDGGWNHDNFLVGYVRVAFSFFMGILLFRVRGVVRLGYAPSGLLVVCLFVLTILVAPEASQVFAVLFFYPAVILLGAGSATSGKTEGVFRFLGNLSYPLYAIHAPFLGLLLAAMNRIGYASPTFLISAAALVGLVMTCVALDRFFDRPIRQRITRRLNLR